MCRTWVRPARARPPEGCDTLPHLVTDGVTLRFSMVWTWFACAPAVERVLARDGDPVAGEQVYAEACAGCHGDDAAGGVGPGGLEGPDLRGIDDTDAELADKILWGWGAMDPMRDVLGVGEVADVIAWLRASGIAP